MKRNYVAAVRELLAAGNDPVQVLSGLKKVLELRGHGKLLGSILRGVERELSGERTSAPKVTVADARHAEYFREAIESSLAELNAGKEHQVIIDESLIGGYVAETRDSRIDASYKRALVELYRTITK